MTRVLLAATSPVVRAGLEALLASSPAVQVVGASAGMAALARDIASLQPDVALLELERYDDDLAPTLRLIGTEPRSTAVVVLAEDPPAAWAAEALRSGVRAVLPREASAEEIVAAVEAAAAGLVVLHADAVDALLARLSTAPRLAPAHQTLTGREIEVLQMLAEGLGNKTIARRLGISEHTVKFHIGSIFSKLDASSRTEAVTLGVRQGLIML